MGIAEYGFALFIFILACVLALLCKYLFGRTKVHFRSLDEKEKKLLALYSTMEDMMDEFNDSALQANAELARQIEEMRHVAATLRGSTPAPAAPAAKARPAAPARASAHVPAPAPIPAPMPSPVPDPAPAPAFIPEDTFEPPLFETVSEKAEPAPKANKAEPDRPARILDLHKQGLDRMQIAKELSVTLSEVDLVLGIAGQRK